MKVVLLKDLKGKGKKGDIIEVNPSYASNFLIPNGYAKAGNSTNLNEAKQAKASADYQAEQIRLKAVELKEKLKDFELTIKIKSGQNGKIFGSVTNKEIADNLEKLGYNVDKKKIEIVPVKSLGTYSAKLNLHPQVKTEIKVHVIAE